MLIVAIFGVLLLIGVAFNMLEELTQPGRLARFEHNVAARFRYAKAAVKAWEEKQDGTR